MNILELVDELFEAFAEGLDERLAAHARNLPCALHLAPGPGIPWSRVFSHEVTLGAPALLGERMGLPADIVRDAVLAHALAVIEAFGTDRIEDGQAPATPDLTAVLARMRRDRDRAMTRIFGGPPLPDADFKLADACALESMRRERSLMLSAKGVDLSTYESASLGKQAPGIVASVALARVAGWDDRRCRAVRSTLESVCLGLQMYDDVVDWEDDLHRGGGSWAICLMRGAKARPSSRERVTEGARIRIQVLQSGVLHEMLDRAVHHLGAARRRASALGAHRLAGWAASRYDRLEALRDAEARSAGYTVRAHALSAWAGEVLA